MHHSFSRLSKALVLLIAAAILGACAGRQATVRPAVVKPVMYRYVYPPGYTMYAQLADKLPQPNRS